MLRYGINCQFIILNRQCLNLGYVIHGTYFFFLYMYTVLNIMQSQDCIHLFWIWKRFRYSIFLKPSWLTTSFSCLSIYKLNLVRALSMLWKSLKYMCTSHKLFKSHDVPQPYFFFLNLCFAFHDVIHILTIVWYCCKQRNIYCFSFITCKN